MVRDIARQAKENGLSVVRTFGFAGRPKKNALMTAREYMRRCSPPSTSPDQASKHDIRVVLVLENYCEHTHPFPSTNRPVG